MRNKWIAVLLVLLLLLSGCGGNAEPRESETTTPPSTQQGEDDSLFSGGKIPNKPDGNTDDGQGNTEDSKLAALREEIAGSGALFGVAYLGYAELPTWADVCVYVEANGCSDEFPFLLDVTEDHAVLQEGGELYAVVPAGKDVSLTVSEFLMDEEDYIPDWGKDLLHVFDGKPLLLRGNVSEIVPNLLITAEKGAEVIECSPCISGMDGSLVLSEGVYDFTPYDLIMSGYPDFDPLSASIST